MDIPDKIITKSPQETASVGEEIGSTLEPSLMLCLYGELGSGKTTFVQGVARGLGIMTRLLSPTFIIVRRHKIRESSGFLYHLDLYRAEEGNLEELAISDILADSSSFIVVEWAQKLGDWLPKRRLDIFFSALHDGTHEIRFEKSN